MKSKNASYRPMEYPLLLDKYIARGVPAPYKFRTPEELKNVLGVDLYETKGIELFDEETRNVAIKLIINHFNGFGLEYRDTMDPVKIEWIEERKAFKLTIKNVKHKHHGGYIYLLLNGTCY